MWFSSRKTRCNTRGLRRPFLQAASDLITARRREQTLVERHAEARMPLEMAEFRAVAYRDRVNGYEHLALVLGQVNSGPPPLSAIPDDTAVEQTPPGGHVLAS